MGSKWNIYTLADLSCDISYGYTASAEIKKVGPKFLRITDIQNGVVNWKTVPYCKVSSNNLEKYFLQEGDIVVARTGNSTGENYLYKGQEPTIFASYLIRFRINKKIAEPLFIWYQMRSTQWWDFISCSKTGSAQAGANAKTLGRFQISLPPLSEQKAIAHILGTLDDKIELNRKMNETLEAIAQALFQSWFVDFDPVIDKALAAGKPIPEPLQERAAARQALGNQRKPLPEDVAQLFPDEFVESELGWIPRGWIIKPLSSCCTELRRGPPPQYTNEEGIKVVNQKCIRNHRIDFYLCKKTKQSQQSIGSRILQNGDILINSTGVGTLGRVAQIKLIKEFMTADSHVTIARPNPTVVLPWFLGRSVLQLESLIMSMGEGSTGQTELNRSRLGDIELLIPVMELQILFESILSSQYQNQSVVSEQEYSIQQIRDTLLPKLISGEIRIPDAEKLLGEVT
jgi:type I restriction enzyme S subunit